MSEPSDYPRGKPVALRNETAVEKTTGSLGASLAATLLAAFSGHPITAVLPVLVGALAAGRHKDRVERALADLSHILDAHSDAIRDLSDAQYKLVNETALSVLQTVEEEKLAYLRAAVRNSLNENDLRPLEADVLSRIIRDISADELRFLIDNQTVERFQISDTDGGSEFVRIPVESREAIIVTGLISLGLLIPGEPTWDDSDLFRFASIVPTLIRLVTVDDA